MLLSIPLPFLVFDLEVEAAGAEEVLYFLAYFERMETFLKSSAASDSEVKVRPIMQS